MAVEIEVRVPRTWFGFSGHRSLEVTLRVPERADLDVRSGDHGTLGAGGAPLRVRTGDGSIRLTAAANP